MDFFLQVFRFAGNIEYLYLITDSRIALLFQWKFQWNEIIGVNICIICYILVVLFHLNCMFFPIPSIN